MTGDYWLERRKENPPEWIWCPVANVKERVAVGPEGGETIYRGLKQFRPGAKLYICPDPWCYGKQTKLRVFGQPRKSRRLVYVVVSARHLESFRVKKVYDKRVIRMMLDKCGWNSWGESEGSRKSAQAMCDYFNRPRFWEEP